MFMFGYVYMNMNIFVTTQVTKVNLEPFCLVEPYLQEIPLRSKWEFVRAIFSLFLAKIKKIPWSKAKIHSQFDLVPKNWPPILEFWGWIKVTCCNQNVHVRGYKISNLGRLRNGELGALLSGTISLAESGPCPGNLLPVDRRDPRRELPNSCCAE